MRNMEYSVEKKKQKDTRCCGCTGTRLQTALLLLLLLFFAVLIAVIVILVLKLNSGQRPAAKSSADTYCMTSSCVLAASAVLKDTNLTADPCNNFMQYACGNWLDRVDIPASMSEFHRRFEIKERITVELKYLLENRQRDNTSKTDAVNKAKMWYQSCIDTKSIVDAGEKPIRDIVEDLGGWPMIDDQWLASNFSLERNMAKSYHYGQKPFITAKTESDPNDPYTAMLHIGQPDGGPESFLQSRNATNIVAYENYIAAVISILGIPQHDAVERAKNLVDFEVDLAKIMNTKVDLYTEGKIPQINMSVAELYGNFSNEFDWLIFFNSLLEPIKLKFTSANVVLLQGRNYLQKFVRLVKTTPSTDIQNYIVWKTLMPLLATVPIEGIERATNTYNKIALGTESSRYRWETCVKQIKFDETYNARDYGLVLSRMWLPDNFDSSSKTMVVKMVENIRSAMVSILEESDWLETETREYAIEKANAVTLQLGYPNWLYDKDKLDSYYSVFKTEETQYIKNLAWMFGGGVLANLRKLKEKPGPTVWPPDFPPIDADAGFDRLHNMFVFPAGIMQPPYFHKDYPVAMNYGAMGLAIGHEFTHAFDTYGRYYDKYGYKKDWWTETDAKKFNKRAECLSEQYSSFIIPEASGERINGDVTIGENIADNGGIKVAHRAYNIWLDSQEVKPEFLPGLDISHHQLFFLSAGRALCGKIRPAYYKTYLQSNPHTPEIYRIKGFTENSYAFSSAFSCSPTSPQNPTKKCSVW